MGGVSGTETEQTKCQSGMEITVDRSTSDIGEVDGGTGSDGCVGGDVVVDGGGGGDGEGEGVMVEELSSLVFSVHLAVLLLSSLSDAASAFSLMEASAGKKRKDVTQQQCNKEGK